MNLIVAEYGCRGSSISTVGNDMILDFAEPVEVRQVTCAAVKCIFNSSVLQYNGWWFVTSNSSPEFDPVKFEVSV
jgi:hypothetical protein